MNYESLKGKKLIILGGNPETGVLVKTANEMGIYTVVIDPNPDAPAKQFALKHYNIDGFDIPNLVKVAKVEAVDGVLVGVADILVPPYLQLCEALNLPCYASKSIIDAFSSKDGFIETCKSYAIQNIPTYNLDENFSRKDVEKIQYPVMVKPVDNGGGVGMSICHNENELRHGVEIAIHNSRAKRFIVERYMNTDDMVAYYTFQDGEIYLSAIADRITTKKQGEASPVCIASVYPSKHTARYYDNVHPKMCELFKGLSIENGVLAIQYFVEGEHFYAYDPGFRLQGEAMHIYMDAINKFDHRKMLINFALKGSMGMMDIDDRNDYLFGGRHTCTLWVLLKDGLIKKIIGINSLKNDPSIIYIMQRFNEGDTVTKDMVGNEKQVLARIYIVCDSRGELIQKIDEIKQGLLVKDEHGDDMIIDLLDTNQIISEKEAA